MLRGKIEGLQCPQAGQAHIRGPVLNGVFLCWPLFVPDGAPLTNRLDRHGGLFLDSTSALLWGGELSRSGELPEDSSSVVRGSLSHMRMGSLPLFGRAGGAGWIGPHEFSPRLVSRRARRRSFSCYMRFACSRNSAICLACSSCFSSISWRQRRN